jgi:hypothetical protein
MAFMRALLTNHPLANIAFVVVLLLGLLSYATMPREQDPEINFNWVSITATCCPAPAPRRSNGWSPTRWKTASGRGRRALRDLQLARERGQLLVRFRDINERTFDKRMADLRREIQNKAASELPREADDPLILEITTSNGFPTASLVLVGQADDETLRLHARRSKTTWSALGAWTRCTPPACATPKSWSAPTRRRWRRAGLLASTWPTRCRPGGATPRRHPAHATGAWSVSVKGVLRPTRRPWRPAGHIGPSHAPGAVGPAGRGGPHRARPRTGVAVRGHGRPAAISLA